MNWPLFLDTNVFVYAIGASSTFTEPSQRVLRSLGARRGMGFTTVAVVQELAQVGVNRGRLPTALAAVRQILASHLTVLPVDATDCAAMADILAEGLVTGSHDALHLAVMRRHGLTQIITADRHFTAVPDLTVLDPAAAAALLDG